MDELTASVIQVGDGRGFIVESQDAINQWIITAAHCLPELPPAHPWSYTEERTYKNLLGPLDGERRVRAECVFADPVVDIAVLAEPDIQKLYDEWEAFLELIEKRQRPAPYLLNRQSSVGLPCRPFSSYQTFAPGYFRPF